MGNHVYRLINGIFIQRFLIQNYVRLDYTSAVTVRNALFGHNVFKTVELTALDTVVLVNGPVQFGNILTSGSGMQAVNVLRDNTECLSFLFKFRHLQMSRIRLSPFNQDLVTVKTVEFSRFVSEESM